MEDTDLTNSSDKLDTIIKSIKEMKGTQNKIITAINQFWEDKKANDSRFNDLSGKLDHISKQFNAFLIKNKSMEIKMEQLETNFSKLELNYNSSNSINQENIFAEIKDRQSRSCNIILFNLPETQSNADDKMCISNIFRRIDVIVDPINVLRLCKSSNKNRPTRATLPTQYDVFEILKNKRDWAGYVQNSPWCPVIRCFVRTLYTPTDLCYDVYLCIALNRKWTGKWTGGETKAECIELYQEITSILASAKLPLRKWCSNSSYVLGHIGKNVRDPLFTLELGDEEMVKSLGLCWNPVLDEFRFNVIPTPARSKLTKRTLLSDLNKVFDPIGFISPILVKGKIFLQQVWALKIDWDSPLSSDIHYRWMSFHKDLEKLQNVSIPRKVLPKPNEFQIHRFCDASQEAYGACIYVRLRCSENTWQVRLLCARSRVAPIKGSTIPRLELNGVLVLAQLLQKLTDAWEIDRHKCNLWTDSTVVLNWLNAQSNRLKVYVSNRVNQILELTNASQWNYVRTDKNPADMIS